MIRIKRAYEPPAPNDGARFLVDHLWPRGVKKENLKIEAWSQEVAPSNDLRKWFGHKPEKWPEFKRRYFAELDENRDALQPLLNAARHGDVTLVFSARDTEHNNAVVLKGYLDKRLKTYSHRKAHLAAA